MFGAGGVGAVVVGAVVAPTAPVAPVAPVLLAKLPTEDGVDIGSPVPMVVPGVLGAPGGGGGFVSVILFVLSCL